MGRRGRGRGRGERRRVGRRGTSREWGGGGERVARGESSEGIASYHCKYLT
jgi:hypothetical protein